MENPSESEEEPMVNRWETPVNRRIENTTCDKCSKVCNHKYKQTLGGGSHREPHLFFIFLLLHPPRRGAFFSPKSLSISLSKSIPI